MGAAGQPLFVAFLPPGNATWSSSHFQSVNQAPILDATGTVRAWSV